MKALVSLFAAVLVGTPVLAQDADGVATVEEAFVACLVEEDVDLLRAIGDAPSQEAFTEALKEGLVICPVAVEKMSMGKFFTALNKTLDALKAADREAAE